MEEYAIYRDYQKVANYLRREQILWQESIRRKYDAEDLEGFKIMFPDEPKTEEMGNECLDDFIEREKYYDNPETAAQIRHLEKYGYFYK